MNSEQDTERTGGTVTLQWMPNDDTSLALDGLISRYQQERRDNYIAGISTGRQINNGGQPMVSVRQISFDDMGSVETATFDGMDVRSEGLVDQFTSTFEQLNLDFEHHFSENFKITATAGRSVSVWDGPMRLQTFMDKIDVPNFTLDFTRPGDSADRLRIRCVGSEPIQVCGNAGWQSDRARRLLLPGKAVAQCHGEHHGRAER